MRVLLIIADGMRPDSLGNIPYVQEFQKKSSYTMEAQTVMPSVTLPCHMSLFHSVDPTRHGTTLNIYMPQVRPIQGLCEVLKKHDKTSAFFYNWEELRDLARPASLAFSYFMDSHLFGYKNVDDKVTDVAIEYLNQHETDFAFLYLQAPDGLGHGYGWMSEEYLDAVENSWKNIERIVDALPEDYTVIITADHGGHDRGHGADIPEDMTIPLFICGKDFEAGKVLKDVNIKDVAPTIAKILNVTPAAEWEGRILE